MLALHTRWATQNIPNEKNVHPHATKNVAIVHNGIMKTIKISSII